MGNAKLSQVPNCPRTMKNTLYECWKIYLANMNTWTNWCIRWPHIAALLIWAKYDDSSLRALSEIDEIDEIGEIDGLPSRGEMWKWLLWRYFWLGRSPMAAPLKKCDDSEGSEWVWSPNNEHTPICASVTPNTSIPSNFMKLSPCDIIRINFLSNWTVDMDRRTPSVHTIAVATDKPECVQQQCTHQSCLGLRFFLPLKPLSENALAIKGNEAVSKAPSSNADMEKVPSNLAQGHKGEEGLPILWDSHLWWTRCTARESKRTAPCSRPLTWQSLTAPTRSLSGRESRARWWQSIVTLFWSIPHVCQTVCVNKMTNMRYGLKIDSKSVWSVGCFRLHQTAQKWAPFSKLVANCNVKGARQWMWNWIGLKIWMLPGTLACHGVWLDRQRANPWRGERSTQQRAPKLSMTAQNYWYWKSGSRACTETFGSSAGPPSAWPSGRHQQVSKKCKWKQELVTKMEATDSGLTLKVGVLLPNCPEYAVVVLGVSIVHFYQFDQFKEKIIFGGDWHFQPRCCTPGSRWQPSTLLTHLTSSLIRFQQFLSRNTKCWSVLTLHTALKLSVCFSAGCYIEMATSYHRPSEH